MVCRLLTERVLRWLAEARPAHVLHLFEQVCNLTNDRGDVVSLVAAPTGPGPFSMVVDQTFLDQLAAFMPVRIDAVSRRLSIGHLTLDTDMARIWDPVPDWHSLRAYDLFHSGDSVELSYPFSKPFDLLLAGIVDENGELCRAAAAQLAGLGNGLTPAGDDILLGVIYALWVWKPEARLIRSIAMTAAQRTTTLSASFLRAAAEGE
ncbi:MAG: DUF2877 domain-containing protein, partial [Candidatus Promineifilaceae bacterium]